VSTLIHPIVISPPPLADQDSFDYHEKAVRPTHVQPQLALQFAPIAGCETRVDLPALHLSPNLRVGQRDPAIWAGQLVAGILEVLAGARSVSQLAMLLSPEVYGVINSHAQRIAKLTPRHRPLVRSVRVFMPTDEVAEAAVVIQGAKRSRAIALRLEVQHGRWRATAIVFG
jgi:hypothetical protein